MRESVGKYHAALLNIEIRLQKHYCMAEFDTELNEQEKAIVKAVIKDIIVSADVAMKYLNDPTSYEVHDDNRHNRASAGLQEH